MGRSRAQAVGSSNRGRRQDTSSNTSDIIVDRNINFSKSRQRDIGSEDEEEDEDEETDGSVSIPGTKKRRSARMKGQGKKKFKTAESDYDTDSDLSEDGFSRDDKLILLRTCKEEVRLWDRSLDLWGMTPPELVPPEYIV